MNSINKKMAAINFHFYIYWHSFFIG